MKKAKKKGHQTGAPPGKGNNRQKSSGCSPSWPGAPNLQGDAKLIEQVRQIIAATPEVRPEKVALLREAVSSETYEIDARKLANCLITKIILDS
jgi:anti-sigma28 factor (negative regulator of flagellin synthesis)